MNIILISILVILLLSRAMQRKFLIPLPIGIILFTFSLYTFFPNLINLNANEKFDEILTFVLPLILLPDAMNFKLVDLKKYAFSIFYLSFVAVILSIFLGILLSYTSFHEYQMTTGMLIALFAMVLATDAVSVSSILSQFKLPHSLRVIIEGESLFNDATAMIAYLFIALPMIKGVEIGLSDISFIVLKVVLGSAVVGVFVGYIGKLILGILHTTVDEFIVLILVGYLAYEIAELPSVHVSGILSLVVAILTIKYFIIKDIKKFTQDDGSDSEGFSDLTKHEKYITTKARLSANEQAVSFFALFANAVLFASLAELIDINKLLEYTKEILIIFGMTTLIRAFMMFKFGTISKKYLNVKNINYRWWAVLTFSGIKGGLSIIMVHHLPDTFIYKEMFTQIVIGVILLSIFVYGFSLVFIIKKYKKQFDKEV